MISSSIDRDKQTAEIWREFRAPLKNFVLKRVGDEQVTDDLLQDVFIKVHAHLDTLRDDARLESWLYQITRNAIADYYRRTPTVVALDLDMVADPLEAEDELRAALRVSVKRMLADLPDEYRIPMQLDMQGMPQAEIAERLGISLSGAKSRVQRGRAKLREMLFDCCHFEFDRAGRVIDYHPRADCCHQCGCRV